MSDPRRRRHRPGDHSRLLAMRPRTSTIVLTVAFLAVFALYILVRPTPASVAAPQPAGQQHADARPHAVHVQPGPVDEPDPHAGTEPLGHAGPLRHAVGRGHLGAGHRPRIIAVPCVRFPRADAHGRPALTVAVRPGAARGQTWRCPAPVERSRAALAETSVAYG